MEKEKNAFVELLNNKNDAIYLEKYDMGTKRTIDEYEKISLKKALSIPRNTGVI